MAAEGFSLPGGSAMGWGLTWASLALAAGAALASVLSALIERSGPIRLRHWAEEADGVLLALYEQPLRFEGFRLVLSLVAKLLPVALFWSLVPAFLAAYTDQDPNAVDLNIFNTGVKPNWRITYNGLSKLPAFRAM